MSPHFIFKLLSWVQFFLFFLNSFRILREEAGEKNITWPLVDLVICDTYSENALPAV